uniref:Chaperone protein DnaJ n=1 Tax=Pseudomonas phage Pavpe01 TaxID=3138545 RepID=A0AAU6VZW7_9VIRU
MNLSHDETAAMLAAIKENRRKLDACPRHFLDIGPPPYRIGQKVECKRCNGTMSLTDAAQYARGYLAAGRHPDEVIPGFFGPDYNHEAEKVTCPKCRGVNGVETSPGDWHDCDFCDATGVVNRAEAFVWLDI